MQINDVKVEFPKNRKGHRRGLHIAIVNALYGTLDKAMVFDTYESSEKLDEFIDEHGCNQLLFGLRKWSK